MFLSNAKRRLIHHTDGRPQSKSARGQSEAKKKAESSSIRPSGNHPRIHPPKGLPQHPPPKKRGGTGKGSLRSHHSFFCPISLGKEDSNLQSLRPKPRALPFGHSPPRPSTTASTQGLHNVQTRFTQGPDNVREAKRNGWERGESNPRSPKATELQSGFFDLLNTRPGWRPGAGWGPLVRSSSSSVFDGSVFFCRDFRVPSFGGRFRPLIDQSCPVVEDSEENQPNNVDKVPIPDGQRKPRLSHSPGSRVPSMGSLAPVQEIQSP